MLTLNKNVCFRKMKAEILELHPTQMAIGFQQVSKKEKKLRRMTGLKLTEYLKSKKVPVVIGPKGKYYIIDHHHLCKAVHNLGQEEVYVDVIMDCSDMPTSDFWVFMAGRKYVWLFDHSGKKIDIDDLPKNIRHLKDDPYRSLAGIIRRMGAYVKVSAPFAEFHWANFLRTKIRNLDSDIDEEAIEAAMIAARSNAAHGLPGFIRIGA